MVCVSQGTPPLEAKSAEELVFAQMVSFALAFAQSAPVVVGLVSKEPVVASPFHRKALIVLTPLLPVYSATTKKSPSEWFPVKSTVFPVAALQPTLPSLRNQKPTSRVPSLDAVSAPKYTMVSPLTAVKVVAYALRRSVLSLMLLALLHCQLPLVVPPPEIFCKSLLPVAKVVVSEVAPGTKSRKKTGVPKPAGCDDFGVATPPLTS